MRRIRAGRVASAVLAAALVAQGCAPFASAPEQGPAPPLPRGAFEVRTGRPGLVVAAPHGTSDVSTDAIARDLSRLTGFGLVVATGFAGDEGSGRRFNVNRPTESSPGAPGRVEAETEAARRVYLAYRRSVGDAARGRLRLYVEVHGNAHEDTAGRVEIATVGLTREDAWRIKTLLELVRDAHVEAGDGLPRLAIWVESLDPLRYTASMSKRAGMLGASERALHIELPRAARIAYRQLYTDVLAEFLRESAALLVAPER